MKAINIKWDAPNNMLEELPNTIDIPDGMTDEDEISNFLSDFTGFCHFGFELTDMELINSGHICMKCLKEKLDVKQYTLYERGYGSMFDGISSKLQLCDECKPENLEEWLDETPTFPYQDGMTEEYTREKNLYDFIESCPPAGKELFWNHYADGWNVDKFERSDALLIEAKIASDDVYRKYNMYTPSEIKASKERFPTCKHVFGVKYDDGSIGYRCSCFDVRCNVENNYRYNTKCNNCPNYQQLVGERAIVSNEELEKKERGK